MGGGFVFSGQPKTVRRKFTQDEDNLLQALVRQYGVSNWGEIAEHVPERTPRQCRDRWNNYLDPEVKRGPWTPEEDAILYALLEQFGPKYVKIAAQMDGRSNVSVKNRHRILLRQNQISKVRNPGRIVKEESYDYDFLSPEIRSALAAGELEGAQMFDSAFLDDLGFVLNDYTFCPEALETRGDFSAHVHAAIPTVRIQKQALREQDYEQARQVVCRELGITRANLLRAEAGYTWHHHQDFNESDLTCSMTLVLTSYHQSHPHTGACHQYEVYRQRNE